MKGLMKAGSGGYAMWRVWKVIGLPRESYVEECAGSHSMDGLWKRWIDTVKECLKKRG